MAAKEEEKELWVDWTRDAISAYTEPDDIKDADELLNDMVDSATSYADAMLEEYKERFAGGTARRRRKKKPEPDPDDDDDWKGTRDGKKEEDREEDRDPQVYRVRQAWPQRAHVRADRLMRLFIAPNKKRTPKKPTKTASVKRANKNNTQRRHPAKIGAPFGRPAK
jgi:hypothetical protein